MPPECFGQGRLCIFLVSATPTRAWEASLQSFDYGSVHVICLASDRSEGKREHPQRQHALPANGERAWPVVAN